MHPKQGTPNASKQSSPRRPGDFAPSAEASGELRWFFNEAESAVDVPSNFLGLLTRASPVGLEAVERRAEAMHAARKIRDRLDRLREADVRALIGLYAGRPRAPDDRAKRALVGRREVLDHAGASALRAYELARGGGPSVAPEVER